MRKKGIGGWLVVIVGGAISAIGSELISCWWSDRKEQVDDKVTEVKKKISEKLEGE